MTLLKAYIILMWFLFAVMLFSGINSNDRPQGHWIWKVCTISANGFLVGILLGILYILLGAST